MFFETPSDQLANLMSLAVDKSTDNSEVMQLWLYARLFDVECCCKDLRSSNSPREADNC